jgi:hypothetical protein
MVKLLLFVGIRRVRRLLNQLADALSLLFFLETTLNQHGSRRRDDGLFATSEIVKREAGELVVNPRRSLRVDTLGTDRNLEVKQRGRARFSVAWQLDETPAGNSPASNLSTKRLSASPVKILCHDQQRTTGYDALLQNLEDMIACDILPADDNALGKQDVRIVQHTPLSGESR